MHPPFLVHCGIAHSVVSGPERHRMASNARERIDDCKQHKAKNTSVATWALKMLPRRSRSFDRLAVPTARAILTRPAYRIIRTDILDKRSASQPRFSSLARNGFFGASYGMSKCRAGINCVTCVTPKGLLSCGANWGLDRDYRTL
jgi:hypothetical protein